ncbi:carbohydrate ABC transporter permease [Phytomonospora endophytica]|uniref:Glucose/mannose transport system permease protein n=1 Tax=Phytomonospora endophytica TaxID=714109 RepID=A0A841FM72_9ACTN|nr:carbohydrate ABC transporter permease [Phytomonospora endophytica]MBB6034898.1 glucose/mannose transport system permease protein [Phytomonospora endophytica]GIG70602.1 ABC transporter permease [Phytomonospora endophytica]
MTTTAEKTVVAKPPKKRKERDFRIQSKYAPYARFGKYAALLLFLVFFLMPIYALIVTSLKDPSEVSVQRVWELPSTWSFASFEAVWPKLQDGLFNSVMLAVPASIISALLGAANGFVLSKWRFPGADFVFPLILFGMFIPYQSVLIPMTETMSFLGLKGGLDGLILVHIIYGLPLTTLIFRSYFSGISDEIIEAAEVDGAGMLRTFFHVALPVAPPAFAVAIIWQFTSAWNDFLFGAVLTTNKSYWPVTIALNNIAGGQSIPFNEAMASALIACLPTLLVYVLLGRFFMRGLMAGALKG